MTEVVSLFPIAMWVAALVGAAIAVWFAKAPVTRGLVIDKLLRYLFFFPFGVQGLWAFSGHVFAPVEVAASIGWAPSPFQTEVGVANLGIGLAAFYAAFAGFGARVAAGVAASCFLAGAGVTHVLDIAAEGNFAPGNAGPIMVTDFLTPIVVLALLIAQPRETKPVEVPLPKVKPTKPAVAAAPPPPSSGLVDELEHARKAMRDAFRGARS